MQQSAGVRDINDGFKLDPEGATVPTWREYGMNIFYPRQHVKIGGSNKLRGGMHACLPNFGTVDEKCGLPQHGTLRTTYGGLSSGGKPLRHVWYMESDKLLGNFKQPCKVAVKAQRLDNGFSYDLSAELDTGATAPVPIGAGLHPYFATPRGAAIVSTDKPYPVVDLLTTAMVIPLTQRVTIDITNLGRVEMIVLGDFLRAPSAKVVLWRDHDQYLCVEPVLALPQHFDTPQCPWIGPGEKIELRCVFKYIR